MSVPHALLALLSEKPKYGLRLQNEFETRDRARSGRSMWVRSTRRSSGSSGTGSSRPTAKAGPGVAEAEALPDHLRRRPRAGRLASHPARACPSAARRARDQGARGALQVPGIDVHALLQVHRRHVIEVMQRYTRIKAEATEDDVPLALVADAELFRLEAIVRWLDAADVRLKQLRALRGAGRGRPACTRGREPTRTTEVAK